MVTVRFFATVRERARRDSLLLALEAPVSVRGLLHRLGESLPEIRPVLEDGQTLVAVNQVAAGEDAVVRDGDEVALMPPFSGGCADRSETRAEEPGRPWARIQSEDFEVEKEIDRVRKVSGRIGGIAVFLGTARDFSRGREIDKLSYEHYPEMAGRRLEEIRSEAGKRFEIVECLIIHRTGEIPAGGNIVLIVAGAEHRDDAFRACRWCIDELKATAPIWKKEVTPDGAFWVQNRP